MSPPAWWGKSKEFDNPLDRGKAMVKAARAVDTMPSESARSDYNLKYARMFEAAPIASLYQYGGKYYGSGAYGTLDVSDRSTWNVMRSVCMAAASMIFRQRIRCRFITDGGNGQQRRRAEKLTAFSDGMTAEAGLYELEQEGGVDSLVFDAGAIEPYVDENDRVRFQRVLSCELSCDPLDAIYGTPRTLYRRRYIDKDELLSKFEGRGKDIAQAIKAARPQDPMGLGQTSGMVLTRQAWHLRSGPDAEDGRHLICLDDDGTAIFDDKWEKDYFPPVFLYWQPARSGMWGRSLCEQLAPMQVQLNRMLAKQERVEKMHATGRVAIQRGTKLVKSQLSDIAGAMLEFSTVAPTILTPPMLPREFYDQMERIEDRMYRYSGISRDQAAGVKDGAVKSGAAIRESIDVQQVNLALPEQRWENFHLQLVRRGLDFVRDLVSSGVKYQVASPNRSGQILSMYDWNEVALDEKNYILGKYPAGILSLTPAGRKDDVIELVNSGLWTKERGLAALDDMDVKAAMSLERAAEQDLERILEGILYDGKWEAPEPYHNAELGVRMAAKYAQLGGVEGVPPMNVDMVRQWMDDCATFLPKPPVAAPAPPMGPPPGMAPPPGMPPMGAPGPEMMPPAMDVPLAA